jgi:hypothetical protein
MHRCHCWESNTVSIPLPIPPSTRATLWQSIDYLISDGKLRTRRMGRRVLLPSEDVKQPSCGDYAVGMGPQQVADNRATLAFVVKSVRFG